MLSQHLHMSIWLNICEFLHQYVKYSITLLRNMVSVHILARWHWHCIGIMQLILTLWRHFVLLAYSFTRSGRPPQGRAPSADISAMGGGGGTMPRRPTPPPAVSTAHFSANYCVMSLSSDVLFSVHLLWLICRTIAFIYFSLPFVVPVFTTYRTCTLCW